MQAMQRISSCCVLPIVTQLLPSAAAASGVAACTCHTARCSSLTGAHQQQWQRLDLDTTHAHLPWSHLLQQAAQQDGQKQSEKEQQTAQQQQEQQQQQRQQQQDDSKQQQSQQEQQQEQQGQGSPDQEQPLEGPDGMLAEWRVSSSQWWSQIVGFMVNINQQYTETVTWAQLYQPKPAGLGWMLPLLRRMMTPEGGSASTWPLSQMYSRHRLIAEFLLNQAHEDFDPDAFRVGVKQALEYTTSLYAASDWVTLKPLVSTALLQSMQQARQQQSDLMDADDVTVTDIELVIDLDSVRLESATALTREQLESLDQQRASDTLPLIPVGADDEETATVDAAASAAAGAAHSATASAVAEGAADAVAWDVAHVYAEGVLHTTVSQGNGPARQVDLVKKGHWMLCRGPVHIDRVLTAEAAKQAPWFLLTWM